MKEFVSRLLQALVALALLTWRAAALDLSGPDPHFPPLAFKPACDAYEAGNYEKAVELFRKIGQQQPSAGAFFNLGNALWHEGDIGEALLAWERAQWISPGQVATRNNLAFARKQAQLNAPELAWYEVCSTWLRPFAWAWLAAISFWTALALILLPTIFRWRRNDWQQAAAAACFAVFLLTTPALFGMWTRTKLGVVRVAEAPLLLTPTAEGQTLVRLPAGDSARQVAARGDFVRVRTFSGQDGWLRREEFGLVSEAR